MLTYLSLKLIWWAFIGVLLMGFAILGGADIGLCSLLPMAKTNEERRLMLNTVGPTWEGNQVWFITFGGALFAAWPLAYAVSFTLFSTALFLVLFALILRPPGFDYRSKIDSALWRKIWDICLFISGVVPALVFGVAFGNLLLGIPFHFDDNLRVYYEGNLFNLLNPFSLVCGIVSLGMLTTQGALVIQHKLNSPMNERARKFIPISLFITHSLFVLCGVWLFTSIPGYEITQIPDLNTSFNPLAKTLEIKSGVWLSHYEAHKALWLIPGMTLVMALLTYLCSRNHKTLLALVAHSGTMIGIILTAATSLFPLIIPSSSHPSHSLTLYDAVSSHLTLTWMLGATLIFLPIVLLYTNWVYRVLKGKVTNKDLQSAESY